MNKEPTLAAHRPLRITILSTADWDAHLWTNKQHIASRLAQRGHSVTYINSLGLRQPGFKSSDLRRIAGVLTKLVKRHFNRTPDTASESRTEELHHKLPTVVSLPVLPFHRYRIARWFNTAIMALAMRTTTGDVLWTFSPVTYKLEKQFTATIYHSVDFLHTLPGVPSKILLRKERLILQNADAVVASSRKIADALHTTSGRHIQVWENVGDVELFRRSMRDQRRQTALFCGNLTPTKVDFRLLISLANSGLHLTVAGPTSIDGEDGRDEVRELISLPNVDYVGTLTQEELSKLCGMAHVGLIPYKINNYTQGVFPLKVYEYLGAGIPVVSTPIPSLAGREIPGLEVCTIDDYRDRVAQLMDTTFTSGERQALSDSVSKNSWETRTSAVENLIDTVLERKAPI